MKCSTTHRARAPLCGVPASWLPSSQRAGKGSTPQRSLGTLARLLPAAGSRTSVATSATAAAADLDRWVKDSNDARLQALEVWPCCALGPGAHSEPRVPATWRWPCAAFQPTSVS